MGILKNQLQGSNLGFKGNTPAKREGALPTSNLHAISKGQVSSPSFNSKHDLDGLTPDKYSDNKPQ
jgi:hypothetical protein